jgi:hypothetical protein
MMIMIAAAALAAQPASVPANSPAQHEPMMQMGDAHEQHGPMSGMKDCSCCKDMGAKHEGHRAERGAHSATN